MAGPGWLFAADAASFVVSIFFVSRIRVDAVTRETASRFLHDLADGWREVRRHRWLTAGFLGFALGNLGVGMYIVLGSVVARDDLGGSVPWGVILGSAAVGSVIGGLLSYRIRPQHPVAAAFTIWALSALPPFALIDPAPLPAVIVAAAIFGGAVIIGNVLWETAIQQEVRPERLGRVASFDVLLSVGLLPVGYLIAGPLSAAVGLRLALVVAGLVMCVPNLAVVAFVREVRALRAVRPAIALPE
jgi:Transmembrane secretion effector